MIKVFFKYFKQSFYEETKKRYLKTYHYTWNKCNIAETRPSDILLYVIYNILMQRSGFLRIICTIL